jgi:hypothetical protein
MTVINGDNESTRTVPPVFERPIGTREIAYIESSIALTARITNAVPVEKPFMLPEVIHEYPLGAYDSEHIEIK